ncbi:helix-turn-helix domain-containing protein [Brucella pseudogrignonensis]|nr:helix-turn-helix domain-containing protein [Brucella pseudogrignonensis]
MTEPQDNTRRAWSWRHAFASSSLPATTKAVLHTLGMFMNEFGESCYPTVADICRYSGFDKKTVLKHLSSARDAGWIAISLHGYRGQKWKRQEYAARWPERDLVAACPPSDNVQGGGAIPPPSQTSNAVDFVSEGGGIEGEKVVEQVHQDKTSPVNIPNTNPSERGASEKKTQISQSQDDPAKFERRVKRIAERTSWPNWAGSPTEWTVQQFAALSDTERSEAENRSEVYANHCRKKGICTLGIYFRDRKWRDLPVEVLEAADKPADPPARLEAKPFGKLFGVEVYRNFLTVSPGMISAPTAFERGQIQRGERSENEIYREKLAKQGWGSVEGLFERASSGRSTAVSARYNPICELMQPVRVGSDQWLAWQAYHADRGWRWYPTPDWLEWVYFPAGGPDGVNEFETALRGIGDDGK